MRKLTREEEIQREYWVLENSPKWITVWMKAFSPLPLVLFFFIVGIGFGIGSQIPTYRDFPVWYVVMVIIAIIVLFLTYPFASDKYRKKQVEWRTKRMRGEI